MAKSKKNSKKSRGDSSHRKKKSTPSQRGNVGHFLGGPLKLLESYSEEYIATFGNRDPFWAKFFGQWRTTYPVLSEEEKEEYLELRQRLGLKESKVDIVHSEQDFVIPSTSVAEQSNVTPSATVTSAPGPSTEITNNGPTSVASDVLHSVSVHDAVTSSVDPSLTLGDIPAPSTSIPASPTSISLPSADVNSIANISPNPLTASPSPDHT
ncbi:hypothetical protein MPER_12448, partial [Moniliophthora perniciosa FA553]